MSDHTPGPWRAQPEKLDQLGHVAGRGPEVYAGDALIARAIHVPGWPEEAEANALVMAAGPEMLSALIQAQEAMLVANNLGRGSRLIDKALDVVNAAIAKAEQEHPPVRER